MLEEAFSERPDVLLRNQILQLLVADAAQVLILEITEQIIDLLLLLLLLLLLKLLPLLLLPCRLLVLLHHSELLLQLQKKLLLLRQQAWLVLQKLEGGKLLLVQVKLS